MIDIIIPAYNAHKTIRNTLISISLQSIKEDLSVYIVNDGSDRDYSSEVELFKNKINIKELKLEENRGPGVARQYGLDNSNNPYIVFIDADDMFANTYSLKNLYETMISDNNEMAVGKMIQESQGRYDYFDNHMGCLHGKMYSRNYIKKYNFKFNSTRSSEDHSFNRLYTISEPKVGYTNELIYFYKRDNENSITNQENYEIESLNWYIYNAIWTVEEGKKRNFSMYEMARIIYTAFYYVYFEYLYTKKQDNRDKILEYLKPIIKYYIEFDKYIDNYEKSLIYKDFEEYFYDIPDISIKNFLEKIE